MASKSATEKRTDIQVLLSAAVAAAEDKKAEDIRILALDPSESGLTDYFLICSGNSDRQNVAITDEIEIRLKRDFGTYPNSVEGRRQGEWILMDYVDFIVHVFSAEKRAFYGLERLRKTATVVSIDELHNEIKSAISSTRKKAAPAKKAVAEKVVEKKLAPAKKAAAKKVVVKKASASVAVKKTLPSKKAAAKKVVVKKAPAKVAMKKALPTKKAVAKKK
jgi:ribosome-associated protein